MESTTGVKGTEGVRMEKLAEHYMEERMTTKSIEVSKIQRYEKTREISVKHKQYLKERHGIQRSLIVQDYQLYQILAIIGTILLAVLISLDYQQCDTNEH